MPHQEMKRYCYNFAFIFLFFHIITLTQTCYDDQWYMIRNIVGGFTMDASIPTKVTIEYFDGGPHQQFSFDCGDRPGLFYIINKLNGNVLDYIRDSTPNNVVVNPRDGTLYQQWILNSSAHIINAQSGLVLDVIGGVYEPGMPLHVMQYNGKTAQMFVLQEKVPEE